MDIKDTLDIVAALITLGGFFVAAWRWLESRSIERPAFKSVAPTLATRDEGPRLSKIESRPNNVARLLGAIFVGLLNLPLLATVYPDTVAGTASNIESFLCICAFVVPAGSVAFFAARATHEASDGWVVGWAVGVAAVVEWLIVGGSLGDFFSIPTRDVVEVVLLLCALIGIVLICTLPFLVGAVVGGLLGEFTSK